MKICKKKTNTSKSLYVVLPQDQLKLAKIKEGDDVCVIADEKAEELIIKKLKG